MVLNVSELHPKNSSKTSCDAPSWRMAWLKIRSKRLSWGDKTGGVFTGEKRGLQRCLTGFVQLIQLHRWFLVKVARSMFLLHVLLVLFLCDCLERPHFLLHQMHIYNAYNMMPSCCVRGSSMMMDIPCVRPTEESMTPKVVSVGQKDFAYPRGIFLFDVCVCGWSLSPEIRKTGKCWLWAY